MLVSPPSLPCSGSWTLTLAGGILGPRLPLSSGRFIMEGSRQMDQWRERVALQAQLLPEAELPCLLGAPRTGGGPEAPPHHSHGLRGRPVRTASPNPSWGHFGFLLVSGGDRCSRHHIACP